MPPPTIAIIRRSRTRASGRNLCRQPGKTLPGQILERRRKQRRVVERLGTHDLKADSGREVTEADIDVVKNFDVVAKETDGLDHDRGVALLAQRGEGVLYRRTDPASAGHALALKGEKPIGGGEA